MPLNFGRPPPSWTGPAGWRSSGLPSHFHSFVMAFLSTSPRQSRLVWLAQLGWLALLTTLSSSSTRNIPNDPAHHAVFGCLVRNAPADGILRLYLDSGGDIYPPANFLPASNDGLRQVDNLPNQQADLQWYFDRNPAVRKQLFAAHGLREPIGPNPPFDYDNVAWDALRREMARRFAHAIDSATANGTKPLLVLIHGFNVADTAHTTQGDCATRPPAKVRAAAYYPTIRRLLIAQRPELAAATWLEVYWDGFQEAPLRIWGAAQLSARYAGLGVREVLRQIQPTTPVRVFTHSAGGIVITQALWNSDPVTKRGAKLLEEKQLLGMLATIPTPALPDLRVGMLVPALTSEAFSFYNERTFASATATKPVPDYRIVVGQNRRDFAVNKGPLGSEAAGATSMGARAAAYEYAKEKCACAGLRPPVDFCVTTASGEVPDRFKHPIGPLVYEEHDWRLYFERRKPGAAADAPPIMRDFLAQVLD